MKGDARSLDYSSHEYVSVHAQESMLNSGGGTQQSGILRILHHTLY